MSDGNLLFDEQVAADYEQWYQTRKGKRYDRIEKSLLARTLKELQPGTLLEVGCGTGHFARFFAQRGWRVTGIDVALPMIQRACALGEIPVLYVVADAAQLPFEDDTFEVVAFVTTLEFLENPAGALTEGFRVARRMLVIGFLNKCSLISLYRRVRSLFRRDLFSNTTLFSGGRIVKMLRRSARLCGKAVEAEHLYSSWTKVGRYGLLGTFGVVGVTISPLSPESARL